MIVAMGSVRPEGRLNWAHVAAAAPRADGTLLECELNVQKR